MTFGMDAKVNLVGWKDTIIGQCRHGLMMYSKYDKVIGGALTRYGEFAESENRLMARFLKTGSVALDVGANVGTVTMALANAVGVNGQVYAFEPQKTIFQYLSANMVLNNFAHVSCFNKAVSDKVGTIQIPDIDYQKGTNFGAVRLDAERPGEVDVVAIDDLALPRCDLIKIDVEGMEPHVLKGAEQTMERFEPIVYTENKSGPNSAIVIKYFQDRNYRLYWHFARFFESNNFRNSNQNIFGNSGDINMLCVPPGCDVETDLPMVSAPEENWKPKYEAWLAR